MLLIVACGGGGGERRTLDPELDAGLELDAALNASGPDAAQPSEDGSAPLGSNQQDAAAADGSASSDEDAGGRPEAGACDRSAVPIGDITCEGCVDEADHDRLLAHYGAPVPPGDAAADVNGDGIVDVYDRSLVLARWGDGCPED